MDVLEQSFDSPSESLLVVCSSVSKLRFEKVEVQVLPRVVPLPSWQLTDKTQPIQDGFPGRWEKGSLCMSLLSRYRPRTKRASRPRGGILLDES